MIGSWTVTHHHHDDHGHEHDHDHDHDHDHEPRPRSAGAGSGTSSRPHSHDSADKVDAQLETSREGLRALWISLVILGVTAALQAVVVVWSGSVALLGDTLHNVADALTAVPLGRRLPGRPAAADPALHVRLRPGRGPRRHRHRRLHRRLGRRRRLGGHRPAAAPGRRSPTWARSPRPAVLGFLGNEAVAQLRIRVGRRIGSAALVADGLHARTDGFTSLAVLLGAGGVAIGWGWADPVVGLVITVAILVVLRDAAREVYRRLMDAVDPATLDAVEAALRATDGVRDVGQVRLRWIGHRLRAECEIVVDPAADRGRGAPDRRRRPSTG